jgi:hypothetical protein
MAELMMDNICKFETAVTKANLYWWGMLSIQRKPFSVVYPSANAHPLPVRKHSGGTTGAPPEAQDARDVDKFWAPHTDMQAAGRGARRALAIGGTRRRLLLRVSLLILGACTAGAAVPQEECDALGKSGLAEAAELPRHAGACAMPRFDREGMWCLRPDDKAGGLRHLRRRS